VRPEAEALAQAAPPNAVESVEPQIFADPPAAAPPAQSAAVPVPVDRERSPWAETADGGKAIGRVSKDAGLATAGFFSKFGRRVAGSF